MWEAAAGCREPVRTYAVGNPGRGGRGWTRATWGPTSMRS
jgi:hypothetical protein